MDPTDRPVPPALLERVVRVYNPVRVWLFGSRARGDARPTSDWDLLVVVPDDSPPGLLDPIAGRRAIRDLALPVDLVTITEADFDAGARHFGTLAQIVAAEGRTVYAR